MSDIARRCAAIEIMLANKKAGIDQQVALDNMINLTGDLDLARAAFKTVYGSDDFNPEDALDEIFNIATECVGVDMGGPYFGGGFRDKMSDVLADVFAAGIAEGQATADYDFETGRPHFTDPANPFRKDTP